MSSTTDRKSHLHNWSNISSSYSVIVRVKVVLKRTVVGDYQAHLIEKATHATDRMKQTNDPKINAYNWLNIKYN